MGKLSGNTFFGTIVFKYLVQLASIFAFGVFVRLLPIIVPLDLSGYSIGGHTVIFTGSSITPPVQQIIFLESFSNLTDIPLFPGKFFFLIERIGKTNDINIAFQTY